MKIRRKMIKKMSYLRRKHYPVRTNRDAQLRSIFRKAGRRRG